MPGPKRKVLPQGGATARSEPRGRRENRHSNDSRRRERHLASAPFNLNHLVLVHHREAAITALNSQAKSCWTTARALSVWSQRPRGRGQQCPAVWTSASSRNSPVRRTAPRPLVVPRGDTFAPTTVRANVRRTPNARAIMSPAAPDTWNRPASRRVAPSRKVSTPLTPRSRVLPSGAQVFGRRALLRRCCEAPVDLRCPGIVRTRL